MDKVYFRVKANGTQLRLTERLGYLTSGMVGAVVEFEYDYGWQALRKTAVFRAGGVVRDVYGVSNIVEIPADVLETYGLTLEVGLYGINDVGDTLPSVWLTIDTIRPGVNPSGDKSVVPLPPLWEQMSAKMGNLDALITKAKDNLVAAINEAAKSGGAAIDPEELERIVREYLEENPPEGGGEDGYSPTITVKTINGGHRLTITDVNGTKTVDVMDGEDGYTPQKGIDYFDGKDGSDGKDGADGFSPLVSVTDITGGHRVTITDKDGEKTFDVMDGKDGTGGSVTDEQIQSAVDKYLEENPVEGGGTETWRLLRTITIPEDPTTDTSGVEWRVDDAGLINACSFSTDADGNTFNCRKLFIRFAVGSADNTTSKELAIKVNPTSFITNSNIAISSAVKNDYTTGEVYIERLSGANVTTARWVYSNATGWGGAGTLGGATPGYGSSFGGRNDFDLSSFKSLAFGTASGYGFKTGKNYGFKVWGVDV